jgi:translation initiation factor IF-2
VAGRRGDSTRRAAAKITVLDDAEEGAERVRSLASVRRAREKERQKQLLMMRQDAPKVVRDVVVPEAITVQELANRMAERGGDVIKTLMRMGVMATITQTIDADTAELVVAEFGHNMRRVSDADVEIGLRGDTDTVETMVPRPPVVTVMGHVDHGKTSLLDALRKTDVAAHEAGGITQHIGAYQVTLATGEKITFIDTPGHAAFTQMRARGAKATDVVILVVAADDGVMPQTVEAITHAKAAGVPIIVAINKVDRPDANPQRVRTELLQYGIQVEEMGGETLSVEVSAKQGTNLDKLAEAILLQSEVLDLKANPDRPAEGVIIETKVERGRGAVATVLVQRGTLKVGDIFVAGSEWGRVRGLMDASGAELQSAEPGMPAEILGLNGMPAAGDDVIVVPTEARAREVTEFRQRRQRDARTTASRSTLEQMFNKIKEGEAKELALVVKADVHGSAEAIVGALDKLSTEDVKINILHAGVGGINESDVTLARASDALIIGFSVRANPQARELARRDRVEIRYYSIIYELADDVKQLLSGMLAPVLRESILGYAEVREVFNISKVGKVAGCMVTEGIVKRGCRLRLLRDNIVIHDGEIGQLKRFKDDVREVREGYDCGISLASFQDLQLGDVFECYEMEEVARQL